MREVIPSLANTLPRCHSTVRELRKSRAPISGLDRPSRASPAIWRSWPGELVARVDGALARLLARGQKLAAGALGERLQADRVEHRVGGAQLLARVHAPALAAQPLAVEQVRAGELRSQPGPAEAVDRVAVRAVGGLALAHQRARTRASVPSDQSLRVTRVRSREPFQQRGEQRGVADPGRRLGELGHDERPEPEMIRLEGRSSGVEGLGVAPETVVQNRARVGREAGHPAARGRLRAASPR